MSSSAPLNPSSAGESVTIMGLGLFGGGVACARWFAERGARVTVTDLRGEQELAPSLEQLARHEVRYVLGRHEERDFLQAQVVVANPAVSPANPFLALARQAGARITSELALALRATRARVALVTGTQGKSSTAHFATELLRAAGADAHLLGNVGRPMLSEAQSLGPQAIAVVEISSYQLESLAAERPAPEARVELAAITNILADHLERHGSVEAYAEAKLSCLRLLAPGGFALIDPRDPRQRAAPRPDCRRIHFSPHFPQAGLDAAPETGPEPERAPTEALGGECARLWVEDDRVFLAGECLGELAHARLAGDFQLENIARALAIARALGAPAAPLREAIAGLQGLPHRLQELGPFAARRVIDNGVSTTPDSTLAAVRALPELGRADLLLLGGKRKAGLSFDELGRALRERELRALCFGADGASIADELRAAGATVELEPDFERAVRRALELAPGALLFSPAAASFDAFTNFQARAQCFRRLVHELESRALPPAACP